MGLFMPEINSTWRSCLLIPRNESLAGCTMTTFNFCLINNQPTTDIPGVARFSQRNPWDWQSTICYEVRCFCWW